jgi:DNA-binding MarR family transcriptional regulator
MQEPRPARGPMSLPQALGRLRVTMENTHTQVSRELGLTAQQAELLCAAMRPTPVGDLARALHCDRSNVSRLVDRAASRGLLYRRADEIDARVSVIELTAEGQTLAERFIATLEARLEPLLATWSTKRQQAAVETLAALADGLEATQPTPPRATRRRTAQLQTEARALPRPASGGLTSTRFPRAVPLP